MCLEGHFEVLILTQKHKTCDLNGSIKNSGIQLYVVTKVHFFS